MHELIGSCYLTPVDIQRGPYLFFERLAGFPVVFVFSYRLTWAKD